MTTMKMMYVAFEIAAIACVIIPMCVAGYKMLKAEKFEDYSDKME